ncbi:MAG: hypothetical protein AAGA87_03095 [Pseudomonadota bacterium]
MSRIAFLWSFVFSRMPYPIRLLMNLVVLPFIIVRMLFRIVEHTFTENPVNHLQPAEIRAFLKYESDTTDPSKTELRAFQDKVRALAEARDWPALGALIERCDKRRESTPDGTRLAPQAIEVIWGDLAKSGKVLEDCGPVSAVALPDDAVAPYLDAADAHPDSLGLSALAAGLSMRMGWSRRGGDYAAMTRESEFRAMAEWFDHARTYLNAPGAAESPLFAGLTYEFVAGAGADLPDLQTAFDRWSRLDPGNHEALALHGWYLLPRWYGDYAVMDDTARKLFAATHGERGSADYTALYWTAAEEDEGAVATLDMGLYRDGLYDMIRASKDRDTTVNRICGHLLKVGSRFGMLEKGHPQVAARRAEFDALFDEIVRAELKLVLPYRWGNSNKMALYALAHTYSEEILAERTVTLGQAA